MSDKTTVDITKFIMRIEKERDDLLQAAEEVLKYVDPANDAGQQPLRQLADAVRRAKGELK